VVGVADGDTIVLSTSHGRLRVRLFGIDAPEADQPFGPESREALADLVLGRQVDVEVVGGDPFGRVVGVVTRGETDVNAAMVRNGWAWHAARYDRRRPLRDAQRAARAGNRGLWADVRPVPPWAWRRGERAAEITAGRAR
jgi:endonuclease YncB( thermonuclease family)